MTRGTDSTSPPRARGARILRSVGRGVLFTLKAIAPVAVIAAGVFLFHHMKSSRPPVVRAPVEEKVYLVDTVTALRTTIAPRLVLYGHIVAGRDVELRPLVSGRVIRVAPNFSEGGIVRKDELVVEIDPFDYRIAVSERRSQLAEARGRLKELRADLEGEKALIEHERAQAELRRRDLARRQALFDRGVGTEKSLDDAELALNSHRQRLEDRQRRFNALGARIDQQTAVIARAEGALTRAERNERDTRLVAPFDGFLHEISTGIGKRVGTNDKIVRLTDANRFEAKFQVTDAQYGRLIHDGKIVGTPAAVVWKTAGQDFAFEATIVRVSGSVSSGSGGVNLFAELRGTDTSTLLRPGVFVEVTMRDASYEDVYRLPEEALQENRFAYAVNGDRLERRRVAVAGRVGNDILVRGRIHDGDLIVARTFPEIGPGVKVSYRPAVGTPLLSRR